MTLSLTGGLLSGLIFLENAAAMLCFIAFVPMLILVKKCNLLLTSFYAVLSAVLAIAIQNWLGFAKTGTIETIIQILIFSLPWVLHQLIRGRHNEKLGYLTLVSSWVFLEWLAAQYAGNWVGLQLGHSVMVFPSLIKWYSFLGVSAGTVWILAVNIQLSRIILPAQAFTRKQAIINGSLVLIAPVLISILLVKPAASGSISGNLKEVDGRIVLTNTKNEIFIANEGSTKNNFYDSVSDTVKNAALIDAEGSKRPLNTKKVRIGNIGGIKGQHLTIVDFDNKGIGFINGSSLLRADLLRVYSIEKCAMLICFSEASDISSSIISSRALENNIDILLLKKDQASLYLKSGKRLNLIKEFDIKLEKHSFFSLYGDLTGRLSIFVTLWMLLGTIVKPYRKK
jgi:hypothetical protein